MTDQLNHANSNNPFLEKWYHRNWFIYSLLLLSSFIHFISIFLIPFLRGKIRSYQQRLIYLESLYQNKEISDSLLSSARESADKIIQNAENQAKQMLLNAFLEASEVKTSATAEISDSSSLPTDDIIPVEKLQDINTAIFLNMIKNHHVNGHFPNYFTYKFGLRWKNLIEKNINLGLLTFKSPEESLRSLTAQDLKVLLKAHNLKSSGLKHELLKRASTQLPIDSLKDQLPQIYTPTKQGKELIEKHMPYIQNDVDNYFSKGELYQIISRHELYRVHINTTDIIIEALSCRIDYYLEHKDWTSLSYALHRMSSQYLAKEDYKQYFYFYFSSLYINISGATNNDSVMRLNHLRLNSYYILTLEDLILKSSFTNEQIKTLFFESAQKMDSLLPFSYFTVDSAYQIFVNYLNKSIVNLDYYENIAKPSPKPFYEI